MMPIYLLLTVGLLLQAAAGGSSTKCSSDSLNRLSVVQQNVPSHIVEQLFKPKRIVFVVELATRSHVKPMIPIAEELIRRGHNVTFAGLPNALDWMKSVPFSQLVTLRTTAEINDPSNETLRKMMTERRPAGKIENGFNGWGLWATFLKMTAELFYEGIYRSLQTAFQSEKPDLLICNFGASACFDFGKANKIPYVIVSPWASHGVLTNLPAFLPSVATGLSPYSITTFDRVTQLLLDPIFQKYYLDKPLQQLNEVRRKIGVAVFNDILMPYRQRHIFVFNYLGMEIPKYLSPFVHMVGPILSNDEENQMDNDLTSWLDGVAERSDESVIYMAFGTVTALPAETLRLIISGLLFDASCEKAPQTSDLPPRSQLSAKVHLLWSTVISDAKEILPAAVYEDSTSYNLRLVRWAPQIKVLKHPAVKLFVSHAGISSIFESNLAGKPMLLLPGFSDQMFNARRAEEIGFGLRLSDAGELSAKEVCLKRRHMLNQYTANETFRQTLEKIAKLVYYSSSRPETVADMMEKEADVGSDYLHLPEDEWPVYRLYNLDIFALLATLVLIPVFGICFLIRRRKQANKSKIN